MVLPIIVFFARIADVTLGTIRIIFVSRGQRNVAPLLGFCEVFIWIVAIGQIVQHLSSLTSFIGYAAGFAVGNYVGMSIEDRLAIGTLVVRIILQRDATLLTERLHEAGFGVTSLDAMGSTGPVKLIYTIVKRRDLGQVSQLIHSTNPRAFFSVEEVRSAEMGIFPAGAQVRNGQVHGRKSK